MRSGVDLLAPRGGQGCQPRLCVAVDIAVVRGGRDVAKASVGPRQAACEPHRPQHAAPPCGQVIAQAEVLAHAQPHEVRELGEVRLQPAQHRRPLHRPRHHGGAPGLRRPMLLHLPGLALVGRRPGVSSLPHPPTHPRRASRARAVVVAHPMTPVVAPAPMGIARAPTEAVRPPTALEQVSNARTAVSRPPMRCLPRLRLRLLRLLRLRPRLTLTLPLSLPLPRPRPLHCVVRC